MSDLIASDFTQFFQELHGHSPFPWQERLAHKVCSTGWPEVIDLPTASGKTACLDIALFALALLGGSAPRRMFFVVDRRVVVNEAFLRMQDIAKTLKAAETGVLSKVAIRLRALGGDDPLLVYEMRGGAFRDETWVKNPHQPLVITSTVDQVGSRLLFRGYGVTENSWPIHAGLIGNDALIILDEAHCSRAFAQTLQRVERYRSTAWAETHVGAPFRFVEMTATPSRETKEPFRLDGADRQNFALRNRLHARKPTVLVPEVKAKKDDFGPVANELTSQAIQLAQRTGGKRIAVFANRVATAKLIHKRLSEHFRERRDVKVELVIGAMRALDRDYLYEHRLKQLKSGNSREENDPLTFVVSTQCLEVGADLDFDALATECASIDALLQRFGRLDRLGAFGKAEAAIVIASWQAAPKDDDPIYGKALPGTWKWLAERAMAGQVAMGIESGESDSITVAEAFKADPQEGLRLLGQDAAILLPTHIDFLVQTSPVPAIEPSIELFLHGPKSGAADVSVVWRRDLDGDVPIEQWGEIVGLCPPSSRETMSVKINVFKKWFAGEAKPNQFDSDLEIGVQEFEPKGRGAKLALAWQGGGRESTPIVSSKDVRPGQTIILRAQDGGWNELGHIPPNRPEDIGDQAAFAVRKSVSLRLHPNVIAEWPATAALAEIVELTNTAALEWDTPIKEALARYVAELETLEKIWPWQFISEKLTRIELDTYPGTIHAHVISARRNSAPKKSTDYVGLKQHTADVIRDAAANSRSLSRDLQSAFETAALYHDYGKVDVRFQAWLRGGDVLAARYSPAPVAKSGHNPVGKQEHVGLPKGFRHELLSLIFAAKEIDANVERRDTILHLVASHHGLCRPFAPVISDENAGCVSYEGLSVCAAERESLAAHRIDSGVPGRFWSETRRFGWWGLAYLDALFRLADWSASEHADAAVPE